MRSRSLHGAAASLIVFFLSIIVVLAAAAIVEHTFTVSQMNMTRLCKEAVVMVVNGQLPGANDRGHGGRFCGLSYRQQVTLQHNNPLA
ncbi:unnamed protein product [Urochloa humidicola]